MSALAWGAVFVGGGLGSAARYALGRLAVDAGQAAYFGTLAANLVACVLLGYLALSPARAGDPPAARLLLATGFCGGFSTFSTFSLEALALYGAGRQGLALGYVAASVALGVASVWLGGRLGSLGG